MCGSGPNSQMLHMHAKSHAQVDDSPPGGEMAVWRVGKRFRWSMFGRVVEEFMSRCYLSGPMAALQDRRGCGGGGKR